MIQGFYRAEAQWWPAVADALEAGGAEWPWEAIMHDLRWWADQGRQRAMGRRAAARPGRPALRQRWRCSDHTARQALWSQWGEPDRFGGGAGWGDPLHAAEALAAALEHLDERLGDAPAAHQPRDTAAPVARQSPTAQTPTLAALAPAAHQPRTSRATPPRPMRVEAQSTEHRAPPLRGEGGAHSPRTLGDDELDTAWGAVVDALAAGGVRYDDPAPPLRCELADRLATSSVDQVVAVARWAVTSAHRSAAWLRSRDDLLTQLYSAPEWPMRLAWALAEHRPVEALEAPAGRTLRDELLDLGLDPDQPVPTDVGVWRHVGHDKRPSFHTVIREGDELVVLGWVDGLEGADDGGIWAYHCRGMGTWDPLPLGAVDVSRLRAAADDDAPPPSLELLDGGRK